MGSGRLGGSKANFIKLATVSHCDTTASLQAKHPRMSTSSNLRRAVRYSPPSAVEALTTWKASGCQNQYICNSLALQPHLCPPGRDNLKQVTSATHRNLRHSRVMA